MVLPSGVRRPKYNTLNTNVTTDYTQTILPNIILLINNPNITTRIASISQELSNRMKEVNQADVNFNGTNTNPFVAANLAVINQAGLQSVIDGYTAGKQISSLETAAGKYVEDIIPEYYGWTQVVSERNTPESEIDSRRINQGVLQLAALKSGPACINDTMSTGIAEAIIAHHEYWRGQWAPDCNRVQYILGLNYSTARKSNKKDFHAVRAVELQVIEGQLGTITYSCLGFDDQTGQLIMARPRLEVELNSGFVLEVVCSQGVGFWSLIGDEFTTLEICCALAIAAAGDLQSLPQPLFETIPRNTLICDQHIPWVRFFLNHFYDEIVD
jgi:hypothetical protein